MSMSLELRPYSTGARVGERRGGEGESEGCSGREGARPKEGWSGVDERKGRRWRGRAGRPRAAEHRVSNDGGLHSAGDNRHQLRLGERGRRRRAVNASFLFALFQL